MTCEAAGLCCISRHVLRAGVAGWSRGLSRCYGPIADAARVGRAGASKAPADITKACGLASGYAKSRVRRFCPRIPLNAVRNSG